MRNRKHPVKERLNVDATTEATACMGPLTKNRIIKRNRRDKFTPGRTKGGMRALKCSELESQRPEVNSYFQRFSRKVTGSGPLDFPRWRAFVYMGQKTFVVLCAALH